MTPAGIRPASLAEAEEVARHPLGPGPWPVLRVAQAGGRGIVDLSLRPGFRRRGIGRADAACRWWGGADEGDETATAFYNAPGAGSEGRFEGRILAGAACETLAAEAEP